MAASCPRLINGSPLVVGSAGSASELRSVSANGLLKCCDLLEVRLDLLDAEAERPWQHLNSLPVLFTARRGDEGGAGDLDASKRARLLESVLGEASLVDIEAASIAGFGPLLDQIKERKLPWIASYHDFDKLPEESVIAAACKQAREAGATAFKLAAHLADESELERLVQFQLADHGIATATMGMGELGAKSRVLCARAGSALNYGHLGTKPTAPGQMSADDLRKAIRK